MVDLAARHAEVADEVERGVLEVLRSGRYVGGALVAQAEAVAASLFGTEGAVGVNSGTDALLLALQAVGVRPGDEVIVPALTFFATAGAVCALGAVPVVVDVREDGCLDPEAAAAAVSRRTRALVPVHLWGTLAACPDLGVPVVDDAAQAVGGKPPRSVGVLTAISTYPTKTWGGVGDGGFVLGDDPERLDAVRRLGNHGMHRGLHDLAAGQVGRNSRLDPVQAAALLAHAPRTADRVARRRAHAARYDRGLPPGVRPVPRDPGSPVHVYPVLVEGRDGVQARLADRSIETRAYYGRALHQEPALASTARAPLAEHLAERLLALPVHEALADEDVDRVLEALAGAVAP